MIIQQILSSGHRFNAGEEYLAFRFRLLNTMLWLSITFSVFYLILHHTAINPLDISMEWSLAIFATLAIVLLLRMRHSKSCYERVLAVFLSLCFLTATASQFFMSDDSLRFVWFHIIMVMAFLLGGGMVGSVSLILAAGILVVSIVTIPAGITVHSTITLFATLFAISIITHLYNRMASTFASRLYQHSLTMDDMVNRDPLTGAYHARMLNDIGAKLMQAALHNKEPLSLLYVDLDNFRLVYDHYSRSVSDGVIKGSAERIKQLLRKEDVLSRLEGDQFGIILPNTDIATAEMVANRIREKISQVSYEGDNEPFSITCSIGLSAIEGKNERFELLQHRADRALYRAKYQGRNQVAVASGSDADSVIAEINAQTV